jgi:maleate cis-trans isomerase
MSKFSAKNDASAPLIGMAKPTARGAKSYATLVSMLPGHVRTIVRYAPIRHGTMAEFAGAIPAYAKMVAELAAEGADLIHAEGTPPFLILGYDEEKRTIEAWEKETGVPVFTSAMCQVNALRALGVRRLVDAGYDPTTGPEAERYFQAAGFDVLAVEKVPITWGGNLDLSEDEVFAMLAAVVLRHPSADGLCLQGSAHWLLSGAMERLEAELGIAVVHPIAARYWELMARLALTGPRPGVGRLLRDMPALGTAQPA